MARDVKVNIVGADKLASVVDRAEGSLGRFGTRAEAEGRRAGAGFDRAAEGADTAEGRAQGLASTLTGTRDSLAAVGQIARGNTFEGLVMLGQGAADLAEGLNYTVIPTAKAVATAFTRSAVSTVRDTAAKAANRAVSIASAVATRVMTAAQWALNVALRANPIGIVITVLTLLAAAIVLAYNRSATFRRIVQGAWEALKAGARVAGDVLGALGRLGAAMFNFGAGAIRGFINGIKSMAGAVLNAIRAVIPDPIERFLHLSSPAKEGPLSKDGGPEGWGRRFGELYTKGLAQGARSLPGGLGGLLTPPGPGAGRAGPLNVTVNARTDADPAEIGREVAWAIRTAGV